MSRVQDGGTNRLTATIIAGIGGALMALSAVMTWGTISLDLGSFARVLGIDPGQIPSGFVSSASRSLAGTDLDVGKWVLLCGVIVLVAAIFVWARPAVRTPLGVITMVGGVVGGGIAVYEILAKDHLVTDRLDQVAPTLRAVGVDPNLVASVLKVSLGIGIYLCVVAGAMAIVGGLLILGQKGAAPVGAAEGMAGVAAAPPPADMGFGVPTAPAAPPPSMPAAPVEAPEPEPPSAPTAGSEASPEEPPAPSEEGEAPEEPGPS